MNSANNNSPLAPLLIAFCMLTVVGVGIGVWWSAQIVPPVGVDIDGKKPTPGKDEADASAAASLRFTQAQFADAVAAVAASEEGDFDRARVLWAKLIEVFPGDSDIRINQAVTVLKWIDTIDQALNSNDGKLSPAERTQLRQEIDAAFVLAESIASDLQELPIYDYRVPLIRAELLNSRSRLTDDYDSKNAFLAEAGGILAEALLTDPQQPLLAASFEKIAVVLDGLDPQLEALRPDVLYGGWQASPRNLYLLRQATEALLNAEDSRVVELLQPSIDLTRPMWSMMQRDIDRIKPDQSLPEVAENIRNGDWSKTRNLRFWLNILKGVPGFNDDSKRVDPDPLVLLDASFLTRLAPVSPRGSSAATEPVASYEIAAATSEATAVAWYDFDFDLQFDVVAVNEKQLRFLKVSGSELTEAETLALPINASGILAIDLFEVQTPAGPKLPSSVAELMLQAAASSAADEPALGQSAEQAEQTPAAQNDPSETAQAVVSGSRHETLQELLLWGEEGVVIVTCDTAADNTFAVLTAETGLEELAQIVHIEPADLESDGDLDLLVITETGLKVFQNRGNRTFRDVSEYSLFPPAEYKITGATACDYDRDLDQDFILVCEQKPLVLENVLHSELRWLDLSPAKWQQPAATQDVEFADFDGNGSWDFLATSSVGSRITSTMNPRLGQVAAMQSIPLETQASEIIAADFNNDGWLDLLLCDSSAGGLAMQLGTGDVSFLAPRRLATASTRQAQVIDRDYDGHLDIVALVAGQPTVFTSAATSSGLYVDVRLAGINDSNGGGRINHYALGSTLEIWADGNLFSRAVRSPVTHFGLGDARPENLRVIFTNGLTQNVEDVVSNTLVEEKQVLRGSCPYVYGWDGERFQLITDLLWNAPLGLQTERGQTLPDRRWEHLLLSGDLVQPKDGKIELRITEELWEVAYFDHVQLTAIDHPADTRVFTNEKVGPPAIAEPRLFTATEMLRPKLAVDSRGREVTQQLSALDQVYVRAFDVQICQGLTEPHFVELDFGKLPTDEELRLFLTGWMYPTDTSLNIGISQNPSRGLPEPPSLWVVDELGEWVCAQPFMGFPGGKPKSIVVDLTDVFRSEDHRLRIASSQQIYWDEAGVAWDSDASLLRQQGLPLLEAELDYRGFSEFLPREPDQPHWFDYERVSSTPNWPLLDGPFTRFGDVGALLAKDDDAMVVMVSGDEIRLQFELPVEPLPPGWRRDYVLHSTGWDKDADINTLAGQGSLPLPFRAQTAYPAGFEQQAEAAQVLERNAPTLTRPWPGGHPASRTGRTH